MAQPTTRRWIAAIGSFGVYAVPLVGPHAAWFLGESLLQGFGSNPQIAWMVTNVAVAIVTQVLAGVVLYWSLGGGWVRKMAWLGVVPLTAALNVAYMSAIPAIFLIEADTAAETNPWTEHCFVRGAELRPIRTPVTQASPSPRAWWAALPPDGRHTLLRVPDCSLTDAVIPKAGQSPEGYLDFFTSLQFASPEGAAIIEQMDRRTSARTWLMLVDPGAPLQPLAASSDRYQSPPVLSHRGDAVAYLETVVGSGPPILHRVQVRKATPESTAPEVEVDLASLGPASYVLMDVDTQTREILVWRDDRPLVVGFDGQSRPIPFEPGEIRAQYSTYLRLGQGWVAWDAYREDHPYQIGWSLSVSISSVQSGKSLLDTLGEDAVGFLETLGERMTKSMELLQGTLDLLILKAISLGALHGYGVLLRLQQISKEALQIPQGALYPALYRLEHQGLVTFQWGESDNNRQAKYYSLTAAAEGGCARKPIIGGVSRGRLDSYYMPPLAMSDLAIFQIL